MKEQNGESSREELTGLSTKLLNGPRKSSLKIMMKNLNLTVCSDQSGRNKCESLSQHFFSLTRKQDTEIEKTTVL